MRVEGFLPWGQAASISDILAQTQIGVAMIAPVGVLMIGLASVFARMRQPGAVIAR